MIQPLCANSWLVKASHWRADGLAGCMTIKMGIIRYQTRDKNQYWMSEAARRKGGRKADKTPGRVQSRNGFNGRCRFLASNLSAGRRHTWRKCHLIWLFISIDTGCGWEVTPEEKVFETIFFFFLSFWFISQFHYHIQWNLPRNKFQSMSVI